MNSGPDSTPAPQSALAARPAPSPAAPPGGVLVPWWAPAACGALAIALVLLLAHALREDQVAEIRHRIHVQARGLADYVSTHVAEPVKALARLAHSWETRQTLDEAEFAREAELISDDFPGITVIAWIEPSLQVRWILPDERRVLFEDLVHRLLDLAAPLSLHHGLTTTQVTQLPDDHFAFMVVHPVHRAGGHAGNVAALFDVHALLASVVDEGVLPLGHGVAVTRDATTLYRTGPEPAAPAWVHQVDIEQDWLPDEPQGPDAPPLMPPLRWQLQLWPGAEYIANTTSVLPTTVLVLGVGLAGLLALAVHLLRQSRLQALRLHRTAVALEEQVVERTRIERELRLLADTLEQRVAERSADLEQKAAELERSNAELDQFASVVSHDLKEPLRVLSIYGDLLRQDFGDQLPAQGVEYLEAMQRAVKHLDQLIRDLLSLARIGPKHDHSEAVPLDAVLQDALENLEVAVAEAGAEVTHDALPMLRVEPTLFVQLFQNLIGNAIKFRSAVPPRVHVAARRDAGAWLFSVQDNGIGFDPKHRERVFVVFQRLHPRDRYEGTGIGLAICKKIVQRHGGRIWVDSKPGVGTTFWFTVPASREVRGTSAPVGGPGPSVSASPPPPAPAPADRPARDPAHR